MIINIYVLKNLIYNISLYLNILCKILENAISKENLIIMIDKFILEDLCIINTSFLTLNITTYCM